MIYFDHNSTTPYSKSVKQYIQNDFVKDWHNPSSIYINSEILNQNIRSCRNTIANFLNCFSKHLYFTSCGTESINTVLSEDTLNANNISSIITSHLEHHASLNKIKYLKTKGLFVHYVKNNDQGEIDMEHFEQLCVKNPKSLVSLLSVNNETGVQTDIKRITHIAKKFDCLVHIDGVQSLGKELVDLEDLDVDYASFSGHKIGALKGVGLLYAKANFNPLMLGGGQERGLRPGTYNYPAIYSLKLAIQDLDLNMQKHVKKLRDHLEKSLNTRINGQKTERVFNTSNFYCNMSNQALVLCLAKHNIAVSTGSACNAGTPEPSQVIQMLNITSYGSAIDYARSCLRVSLAASNSYKEIDTFINVLKKHAASIVKNTSFKNRSTQLQI